MNQSTEAVSYTHLDVYKRQHYECAQRQYKVDGNAMETHTQTKQMSPRLPEQ